MNYNELVELLEQEFGEKIRDYGYRKLNFCKLLEEIIPDKYFKITNEDFVKVFGEYEYITKSDRDEVFDEYSYTRHMERIIYFKEHDVYIRCKGEFSSYSGTEWHLQEEVFPRKVVITAYETSNERGNKTDEV